MSDCWAQPLPPDQPDWEVTLERHLKALQALRDTMAEDYQRMSWADTEGRAADLLGEKMDKLCDLIAEFSQEMEDLR